MSKTPDFNDAAQIESLWRAHLATLWGSAASLAQFRQLSAGFSWRTFAFSTTDAVHDYSDFILQIGPSSGLFAPYTTRPQQLALQSLEGAAVPAPSVLAAADGDAPFGAPWMVTQRIAGDVPLPWTLRKMDEAQARGLSDDFVSTLARLHAVPWQDRPVAALDPDCTANDANRRQIDHWSEAIARWQRKPHPGLALAERWLRSHAPPAPHVSLVHGDYRIGNFLRTGTTISGILDWEMAHLGDPHEDLAWALLPMFNGGSRDLAGRVSRAEVFALYEKAGGMVVDAQSMNFHEVLALYKSIAIDLAAIARYEDGGLRDLRLAAMGTQVAPILKQLLRALEATP